MPFLFYNFPMLLTSVMMAALRCNMYTKRNVC